jgi:(4S)-4-hydroxy-5-phosphonooxypentane-2,3-dione isomerase
MSGYAITVDFKVKAGAMTAFRALIDRNAVDSCRDEAGCRRFDVLVPAGESDRILLYEIYDNRQAFDEHLKTPHFESFNRDSAALVTGKSVAEFELVCEGSQG